MPTFADKSLSFYKNLKAPAGLPKGVSAMNPYEDDSVCQNLEKFLKKFFNDDKQRIYVFGINPGRFGAGLTGVTFTDPVCLEEYCGIKNDLDKRKEISAEFVYKFINHYGGASKFYNKFFLTAVSPIGFVRNGINYNYYDDKELLEASRPFVVKTMHDQLKMGANRNVAIVLGTGKNQNAFNSLNEEFNLFKTVYFLDHPRFIMQYRRKRLTEYLDKYKQVFSQALHDI
ncbi:MAG: uracil-DNA glycosylase family protein [Patescibacteria group bacterium]